MALDAYFLAGHPALDFANTLAAPEGTPVDFIPDGMALLKWLVRAELIAKATAEEAGKRFSAKRLNDVAAEARVLRNKLRGMLPMQASNKLPKHFIGVLNRILAAGGSYSQIELRGGRVGLVGQFSISEPERLLLPIAASIADLLAHVDPATIKACANNQCILWFVDRTRGGRRLYCSAAICGNRHKVAAFRARKKAAEQASASTTTGG